MTQGHPRESGRSGLERNSAQRMSRAGPWWWSRPPRGSWPPSSFSDSRCADLRDPGAHAVTPGAQVSESRRAGERCGSPGRLSLPAGGPDVLVCLSCLKIITRLHKSGFGLQQN